MSRSPRGTAKANKDIEIANAITMQVSQSRRSPRDSKGRVQMLSLMPSKVSRQPQSALGNDEKDGVEKPHLEQSRTPPPARHIFPFTPVPLDTRNDFTWYEHDWVVPLSKNSQVKKVLGFIDMKFRQIVSIDQCRSMTKEEAIAAEKVNLLLTSIRRLVRSL